MTAEEKPNNQDDFFNFWSFSKKVVLFGFLGLFAYLALHFVLNEMILNLSFSVERVIINSITLSFYGGYFGALVFLLKNKIIDSVFTIAKDSKFISIFAKLFYAYLIIIFALLIIDFIPQFDLPIIITIEAFVREIVFPILQIFLGISFIFPVSKILGEFNGTVYQKKRIANSITFFIPTGGLFLFLPILYYFNKFDLGIQSEWLTYAISIVGFLIIFYLFVDLPYSISVNYLKKVKNNEIDGKRKVLIQALEKESDDTQESFLKKISLEHKISRLDREKADLEKQSIHPYKIIIPFVSFASGVALAIITELIKNIVNII